MTEDDPTDDDWMLLSFIPAAREIAEIYQAKDLVRKQYDLTLDNFSGEIELAEKLVSVDLVKYRTSDGTYTVLVEETDFVVDIARRPGVIVPAYGLTWPAFTAWPSGPVLIRFTAGLSPTDAYWNDAGARVKVGMLYLILHWFLNRNAYESRSVAEIPFSITMNLSFGANPRVR